LDDAQWWVEVVAHAKLRAMASMGPSPGSGQNLELKEKEKLYPASTNEASSVTTGCHL